MCADRYRCGAGGRWPGEETMGDGQRDVGARGMHVVVVKRIVEE